MERKEGRFPRRAPGEPRRGDRGDPGGAPEDIGCDGRMRVPLGEDKVRGRREHEGRADPRRVQRSRSHTERSRRCCFPRIPHEEADVRAGDGGSVRDLEGRSEEAALRGVESRGGAPAHHGREFAHRGPSRRDRGVADRQHQHTQGRPQPGRLRHGGPALSVRVPRHRRPHLYAQGPVVRQGDHAVHDGPRRLHQRLGW